MEKNRIILLLTSLYIGTYGFLQPAAGQEYNFGYSNFGGPGMIDMPTAFSHQDAELGFNSVWFQNTRRFNLTFQLTPRLSASFRYSQLFFEGAIDPITGERDAESFRFDRVAALHYRVLDEGLNFPSISVGVNDVVGNGYFQSEYIVATKTLHEDLHGTLGLGFGRMGSLNSLSNPLGWDTRPPPEFTQDEVIGGQPQWQQWFHGQAAVFGGVEWQASDRLRLTLEYSSDRYRLEDGNSFVWRSPVNFGLVYRVGPSLAFEAQYLYGSEVAAGFTYAINPKDPPFGSGNDRGPMPVINRNDRAAESWIYDPTEIENLIESALSDQNITLFGIAINGNTARVSIETETYGFRAQTVGRAMRALSNATPPNVEIFAVTLIENGIPVTEVLIARDDIEDLEFEIDGAWTSYTRANIGDVTSAEVLSATFPRFDWDVQPYVAYSLFDPDAPLRLGFGIEIGGNWEPAPGVTITGAIRKQFFGNIDDATRPSDSLLPRVRSESNIYDQADPSIPRLTSAWYFRPSDDLFGRVTIGYLETMFAGISGEVLWAPNDSRLALGVELNEVVQRDFDQIFGLRNYQVTTGHISAYLSHPTGFGFQLDAGRYLAGDWGATLTMKRSFDNGWRLSAFATLTDVPFEEFGEGSFDKGIILEIPISWASGQPDQRAAAMTIRPILRDGGARLNIDGRLYDVVSNSREPALRDAWGRFWR